MVEQVHFDQLSCLSHAYKIDTCHGVLRFLGFEPSGLDNMWITLPGQRGLDKRESG
jgi:hypothetical protein